MNFINPLLAIIRWQKVWRDLWVNKTRTLLVVLAIAVGVFALGAVTSTRLIVEQDLNRGYLATEPSSAILFVNDPFDKGLVESIRRMDGVLDAEGRHSLDLQLKVRNTSAAEQEVTYEMLVDVLPDYDEIRLDRITPEGGAWPPPFKTILLERASLSAANAQVGEFVRIQLPDGDEREMEVSGITHDINRPSTALSAVVYGYITLDTLEWLGYSGTFNQLRLRVDSQDKEEIEQVAVDVEAKIEKSGRTVAWKFMFEPGKHVADSIIQPILTILEVLGYLTLMLSALLVSNTISGILAQHTRQIGMMKSIGASSFQLVRLYLGMILSFGFLALLLAIPLGALAAFGLVSYLADIINFDLLTLRIPPTTLVLQLFLGIAVPIGAALLPVITSSRLTVREALNRHAGAQSHLSNSWLDRLLEQIRFLPSSLLFSLRNTLRRKARLALTVSTLVLAGTMFITLFTIQDSLLITLEELNAIWNYDVSVQFSRPYRSKVLQREAQKVPSVIAVEAWNRTNANRVRSDGNRGPRIDLYALPADSRMIRASLVAGRWLLPDDQNAIVLDIDILKEEPDIKVADIITLKLWGHEIDWQVVGIVKPTLNVAPFRFGRAYVNYAYYAQAVRLVGRANSLRVVTSPDDKQSQLSTTNQLKTQLSASALNVQFIRTSNSLRETVALQFNVLLALLTIMAIMLALVGTLGLTGTMSLNVIERVSEIGILRAIGAENHVIMRIFIVEGILIGTMSWPFSLLLAWPISQFLSHNIGMQFTGLPLLYTFSQRGALYWLGGILLLSTLASYWPARDAARLTVRDVLAHQ